MESGTEIKFIASANTQLKPHNRYIHPDIFPKIEKLIEFLGFRIVSRVAAQQTESPTRQDIYFDDQWRLARGKASLSIRAYNAADGENPDRFFLTAKFDEGERRSAGGTAVLARKETHAPLMPEQAAGIQARGISLCEVRSLLPNAVLPLGEDCRLTLQGRAYIRRSIIKTAVGGRVYQVSVDKFYFLNETKNRYSETFTEVEIENSDSDSFDPEIYRLVELLQIMFDVELQPVSKYQRFRKFSIGTQFRPVFLAGWDMVGYTRQNSWTQKQVVQRFHKIIKDAATATGFFCAEDMTSISIGDGAILAAETDWSAIETLVREVHTRVQANNRGDRKRRISYRLAVHWGPVFPFTDLNDGINIAGEGINTVSRLLGVAKPGKPLVSAKARDHIVDGAPSAEDMFEPDTAKTVKHGLRISAYIYKGL